MGGPEFRRRGVDRLIPNDVLQAGKTFFADGNLVGGATIQSSHMPPATRGEYSLQVITAETDLRRLAQAKVLVVGCMDKRQAEALYQRILDGRVGTESGKDRKKYKPEEVVMIIIGGGIIQTGERETALKTMIDFVVDQAPDLKHLVVSAHTSDSRSENSSPCEGVKFLNGGIPLAQTLTDDTVAQLETRYGLSRDIANGAELMATGAAAQRHAADIMGHHADHPSAQSSVLVIVPDDNQHRIRQVYRLNPDAESPRLEALANPLVD